jgi:ATP-dependent DNA ligase
MESVLKPPYLPMEARLVDSLPRGEQWLYEPKWDGFRCLVFKEGEDVRLQSKAGQPLERYFPEVVECVRNIPAPRFVLDSELVIPIGEGLSFDHLLLRIHPAESRIRKLSLESPAALIAFDLLLDADGNKLADMPLRERRPLLEQFAQAYFEPANCLRLSPVTADPETAESWLQASEEALDGVMAKRLDMAYRSNLRDGMQKIKRIKSADCVVGGFRYASAGRVVGSLLLGLYDSDGLLHHVGYTSSLAHRERVKLTAQLEKHVQAPGFTGRAPGGPSRWSTARSGEWEPLAPVLVVEVAYDHFSGNRFRHGTRFKRWRPDKAPQQCTFDQLPKQTAVMRLLTDDYWSRA